MFRRIRIALLLLVLAIVAANAVTDGLYSQRWNAPVTVALYPINGDRSEATANYIASLTPEDFAPIETFLEEEAAEYAVKQERPIRFTLAPPLSKSPPAVPVKRNTFNVIMWSLEFRWWAWWTPPKAPGPTPRVRLFLSYFDPAKHDVLDHSVGLRKGLIAVVQLYADPKMLGSNQTVIAHELLHTFGATDKYDPANNLPNFPDGFAEPNRQPRYPQQLAELMGGRIPTSATEARIPDSLREVVVGPVTATEIGWLKDR